MHLSRPVAFLVAFLFLTAPLRANAQKQASITSTNWCKDSGTYCWAENSRTFSGIRFVAEPKFGYVFPGGASLNRIESEGLGKLTIFGFETNLVGTFASFQFALITPGTVKLDGKSPLRSSGRLVSPAGEISLDSGLAAGFLSARWCRRIWLRPAELRPEGHRQSNQRGKTQQLLLLQFPGNFDHSLSDKSAEVIGRCIHVTSRKRKRFRRSPPLNAPKTVDL